MEKLRHHELREQHDPISPTAKVIAALRADTTSIPFSKEIATASKAHEMYVQFGGKEQEPEFALLMEARFRTISKILEDQKPRGVIDIGAGLSPRGLQFSEEGLNYIEFDLPEMAKEKVRILSEIIVGQKPKVVEGNATKLSDIQAASVHVDGPIVVVTEGVLPYMYRKDLEQVVENIAVILREKGGKWVTDIATQDGIARTDVYQDQGSAKLLENLYKGSQTDVAKLGFKDTKDAEDLFTAHGFSVERVPLSSVSDTVETPEVTGLPKDRVDHLLKPKLVWVLSIKA